MAFLLRGLKMLPSVIILSSAQAEKVLKYTIPPTA